MSADNYEFTRIVPTQKLGDSGQTIKVTASTDECKKIAQQFDLLNINRLEAVVTLRRWRGPKGLAIDGTISADIVQACVVSLEPVPARIEESFSRRFLRPEMFDRKAEQDEVLVDPDAEDPPEPWEGDTINLGALIQEHFALGIDPYPRLAGAELKLIETDGQKADKSTPSAGSEPGNLTASGRPNPFAILKDRFPGK